MKVSIPVLATNQHKYTSGDWTSVFLRPFGFKCCHAPQVYFVGL